MTNDTKSEAAEPKKARRPKRTLEERKADAQAELDRISERELQDLIDRQGAALLAIQAFGRRAKEMGREDVTNMVGRVVSLFETIKL